MGQYEVEIIKFNGSFKNLTDLNKDIRDTRSELVLNLEDSLLSTSIPTLDIFGIITGWYKTGEVGLISQDEGYIEDVYHLSTNFYNLFDDKTCDIISSYLTEGSKLVISFKYEHPIYFIFEPGSWERKIEKDLF